PCATACEAREAASAAPAPSALLRNLRRDNMATLPASTAFLVDAALRHDCAPFAGLPTMPICAAAMRLPPLAAEAGIGCARFDGTSISPPGWHPCCHRGGNHDPHHPKRYPPCRLGVAPGRHRPRGRTGRPAAGARVRRLAQRRSPEVPAAAGGLR